MKIDLEKVCGSCQIEKQIQMSHDATLLYHKSLRTPSHGSNGTNAN